jgi:hypothetical protein
MPAWLQGRDEDYRNFQIFDSDGNLLSEKRTIDGTSVSFNTTQVLYLGEGQYTLTTTDPTLVGWDASSNFSYISGSNPVVTVGNYVQVAHPAGVLSNSVTLYVNNRSQYSLTPF